MSNTKLEWVPLSTGEVLAPDGSGAPALITVQGRKWSCDFLGSVKVNPVLARQDSGRAAPKWMAAHVEKTYLDALKKIASPEWFALNAAMYSEGAS